MSATGAGDQMRSSQMSEVWRPNFDLKDCKIKQDIMDPPPSYQSLQALLQRGMQKFNHEMSLSVEVQGVYALPDEWTTKIVSFKTL